MKKQIPNIVTCCNLICGCIAICAAFQHWFTAAFIFILVGAVFDFFDGLLARALGVSGRLGLELDSLADVVTFGVAPSAMLYMLFREVRYPGFVYNDFWFMVMPLLAFLIAAFSAYRLAKFNIDERQHTTFIGMPTPANAIFWAALISSSEEYLTSPMFNSLFLLAFELLFCWLLVCNVPMFSLKFANTSWADNKVKYIFILLCILILALFVVLGLTDSRWWMYVSRGIACCVGLYVVMGLITGAYRKVD